ncbi:hypothetical protein [Butyricimonas muris]|uniref:hypothetical protein n=1 Tax=Butyricimonas muris TaxID=3378067 RepID=UPI003966D2F5
MKRLIFSLVFLLCVACGSRKMRIRNVVHEEVVRSSQLDAQLFRSTELLKLLDVRIRRVEERDSIGNEKITIDTRIRLKEKITDLDTTKVKLTTGEKRGLEQNTSVDEVKKSGVGSWVWSVWGGVVIAVVLVVVVYRVRLMV